MSKFTDLGEDLANIVCDFAFACRYSAVFYSLKHYLHIMCFRVPEQLIKRRIYSHSYRRVLPNPLKVFEPIQNFGSYRDLFDWNRVHVALAAGFQAENCQNVWIEGALAPTPHTRLEERPRVCDLLPNSCVFT